LEHLSKVDSDTLADGLVDGVINIQFNKSLIARVQHRKDADHSIVVNLIVAEIQ
jgi:hypothetical protein